MSQVVSTCSSLDHPCIEGLIVINAKREQKLALFTQNSYSPTGLHKLWYPVVRDMSTWSKFGAHGEHGDVFLFSNLGAL